VCMVANAMVFSLEKDRFHVPTFGTRLKHEPRRIAKKSYYVNRTNKNQ